MRSVRVLVALAALSTVALAGCRSSGSAGGEEDADPFKIGVIMDTSGTAAFYSGQAVKMIEFAADQVNKGQYPAAIAAAVGNTPGISGRQVEIITEDDGSDPNRAVQAARKLVSAGAQAIISTSGSASALQSRVVCQEEKIPCIAPYSSSGAIVDGPTSEYVFTIAPNSAVLGETFAGIFKAHGYKTFAIVGDSSPTSSSVTDLYQAAFEAAGLQMVAREVVPVGATDATSQVSRIRGANPDVVYDSFAAVSEEGLFYKSAGDTLADTPRWGTNGLITSDETAKVAGAAIEGVKTLDVRSSENEYGAGVQQDFLTANPDLGFLSWTTITNWEAMMIFKKTFEEAGTGDGAAVRAKIESLTDLPSVLGPPGYTTSFSAADHNGSTAKALVPVVFKADGSVVLATDETIPD